MRVTPELWYIPFSPWSLKARCALRLRGVAVQARPYTPLIDEPLLRLKLRRARGRVTVPVLFTEGGALCDSWDIALYAERAGSGASIIPKARQDEIRAFNDRSERLLEAGRVGSMLRVLQMPEAALEAMPPAMRRFMGTRGALFSVAAFNRKYGIAPQRAEAARTVMRRELSSLRDLLRDGRRYLLGDFSYADVVMGIALQLVKPVPDSPMGELSKRAATDDELASEFADLLAYRDRLQAEHELVRG